MSKGTLNRVILIGNLGRDPESRYTAGGSAVTNLALATAEVFKDAQGTQQEKTEWHRVVVFGRLAEIAAQYLRKGAKVAVEGRLETKSWEDKQGAKRYTTEVVIDRLEMLDRAEHAQDQPVNPAERQRQAARDTLSRQPNLGRPAGPSDQGASGPVGGPPFDDDIPF